MVATRTCSGARARRAQREGFIEKADGAKLEPDFGQPRAVVASKTRCLKTTARGPIPRCYRRQRRSDRPFWGTPLIVLLALGDVALAKTGRARPSRPSVPSPGANMLFHVKMMVQVPHDADPVEVKARGEQEHHRASDLQTQGKWPSPLAGCWPVIQPQRLQGREPGRTARHPAIHCRFTHSCRSK